MVNPSSAVQAAFFKEALQRPTYDGVLVEGPLHAYFQDMQSRKAERQEYRAVGEVSLSRLLRGQGVPGVLDRPLYRAQGEGEPPEINRKNHSSFSGTNACFRMIMDTVTGWLTDENALRLAMANAHNRRDGICIAQDTEFWNIFESEAFRGVTPRRVQTAYVSGADFAWVTHKVSRAKERLPGTLAYCVVNYRNNRRMSFAAHTAVLVGPGDAPETVRVLDPLLEDPNDPSWRDIPLREFAGRWAIYNNAAALILAHPPRGTSPKTNS